MSGPGGQEPRPTRRRSWRRFRRFRFNAPNDQAYFVGAISSLACNRVEIREVEAGIENEFYHTTAVPLPAAAWAAMPLLGAIPGIKALRRRSA